MVLLVDGNQWKVDKSDHFGLQHFLQKGLSDLLNTPSVRKRAECLKNASSVTIDSENDILYLHQGEMATVPYRPPGLSPSDMTGGRVNTSIPHFAGTSEMTSCHAVLINSSSGYVLGHLDGSGRGRLTEDFFNKAVQFFTAHPPLNSNEHLQVHIVGGFIDNNDLSKKLTAEILTALLTSTVVFRLRTLCSYILNDFVSLKNKELIHAPAIRSLVFDASTNTLCPAVIPPRAMGPLGVLRASFTWSKDARRAMQNVFDFESHQLILKPFHLDEETLEVVSQFEFMPRNQLEMYSTTPRQETSVFYELLRLQGRLISHLSDSKRNLFAGGDLRFVYDANLKHWYPDGPNAEEALKIPLTGLR